MGDFPTGLDYDPRSFGLYFGPGGLSWQGDMLMNVLGLLQTR